MNPYGDIMAIFHITIHYTDLHAAVIFQNGGGVVKSIGGGGVSA